MSIKCNKCKAKIEKPDDANKMEVFEEGTGELIELGYVCYPCLDEIFSKEIEYQEQAMYDCCYYGCMNCAPELFEVSI